MNVSSPAASAAWPTSKSTGKSTRQADGAAADFLKFAKMSPMERMRANILKSMDLTEDKLSALPQDARRTIEDQIEDGIRKLMASSGEKDRLVDIRA